MEKTCTAIKHLENCCCECAFQYEVFKHPCNANEFAKGSIMDKMGWICLLQGENRGIFMDREHSLCEEYTSKG